MKHFHIILHSIKREPKINSAQLYEDGAMV